MAENISNFLVVFFFRFEVKHLPKALDICFVCVCITFAHVNCFLANLIVVRVFVGEETGCCFHLFFSSLVQNQLAC